MLIRLIPDQVESRWEYFAPAIAKALPPTVSGTKRAMVNILESVLLERLTVWLLMDEDQEEVFGILTTTLKYERISKTRNLLIYSFTSFSDMHFSYWNKSFSTIVKHALANNCQNIIAYTRNEKIVKFFEDKGAEINNHLIQMEV